MNTYFSTFITGTQEIVKNALLAKLPDVEIVLLLDGLVIYKTTFQPEIIKQLRFLNNSFALVHLFKGEGNLLQSSVSQVIDSESFAFDFQKYIPKRKATFRVMFYEENQPARLEPRFLRKVEAKITRPHLIVDRANPEIEFSFLTRKEGYCLFGLRLTRHRDYKKTLKKGELRPELANLMCLLSEPSSQDMILDPFAGSGAIVFEYEKDFPLQKAFASDIDTNVVKELTDKVQNLNSKISVSKLDALALKDHPEKSIDKIITDPPWGIELGKSLDLSVFYKKMLEEFIRILSVNGLIIILIGQKDLFEECLEKFKESLELTEKYDILVSGKKAAIYKIKAHTLTGMGF